MKFAAMNFHYIRYSLEYFLDEARRHGFCDIELWAAAPHFYIGDVNGGRIRLLRRELEARGQKLCCVTPEQCVYPVNLAIQDKTLRERSISYFKKAVDAACALDCSRVIVTPGYGYFDRPWEEAWDNCAGSLSALAQYAAAGGVELLLECLLPSSSNILNDCAGIAAMLKQVDSPSLNGMVDFCQMAAAGQDVADYFEVLGSRLRHVHFVDGSPGGHLAPGDGFLPLAGYARQLAASGYKGYCSLELCDKRYYPQPIDATKSSVEWLRRHQLLV